MKLNQVGIIFCDRKDFKLRSLYALSGKTLKLASYMGYREDVEKSP